MAKMFKKKVGKKKVLGTSEEKRSYYCIMADVLQIAFDQQLIKKKNQALKLAQMDERY